MKKIIIASFLAIATSITVQAQELPKPSPSATVTQTVGLTDISVVYSRPGVKNRTIWGDLVPYGKMWRAGANKATMFSTSADIIIANQQLPKGEYSLFIIPEENAEWTVIFNKETELWGTGEYDEAMDQLRITVAPAESADMTERLEFRFSDVDMSSAVFSLNWEKIQLNIAISADPTQQAITNIENALSDSKEENKWKVYRSGASYARDVNMTKKGLEWIQKSVELNGSNWYSYWVYASLLAQNNEFKKATEMASKSIKIGTEEAKAKSETFSYEARIQADIDSWKTK
jgi:tetratricopeptide (TPR) repeat protein